MPRPILNLPLVKEEFSRRWQPPAGSPETALEAAQAYLTHLVRESNLERRRQRIDEGEHKKEDTRLWENLVKALGESAAEAACQAAVRAVAHCEDILVGFSGASTLRKPEGVIGR